MRRARHISRIYWLRAKLFFTAFLIILFFTFTYWFVFLSPYFQIKEIIVQGFTQNFSQKIELYLRQNNVRFVPFFIYGIFPQYLKNNKSYATFFCSDLKKYFLKQHPEIEKMDMKLNFKKGTLLVNIKQREIDFLWCVQGGDCFYMDKNGVVFEKAPETQGSFIRKIVFLKAKKIVLGNKVISPSMLEKLDKIFILTEDEKSPISIDSLEIKRDNFSEVKLITNQGFYVFYNLKDDFAKVLKIIIELKEQKIIDDFTNLKSIDCRYLPKIYYQLNK